MADKARLVGCFFLPVFSAGRQPGKWWSLSHTGADLPLTLCYGENPACRAMCLLHVAAPGERLLRFIGPSSFAAWVWAAVLPLYALLVSILWAVLPEHESKPGSMT